MRVTITETVIIYLVTNMALTPKQEMFCREYLIDLNATQAAIRAGYSEKTANEQGARLLANVSVSQRVSELKAERNFRVEIDAEYVLNQAVKLHERCMQEVVPFTDKKGEHIHDDKGNPLYVFDSKGAAAALALVGKHVKVNAFKEIHEHNVTLTVAEKVAKARRRVKKMQGGDQ